MKNNVIKISEGQLRDIISEAVKQHMNEEFNGHSNELKAAAEEYAKGEGLENALGGWEDLYDAFIRGALWQKGHMEI